VASGTSRAASRSHARHRDRQLLIREVHRPPWRRKLQAAYAHPTYADAKRALERLHRELWLHNESAALGLAEGLEETLTPHRLNVFPELGLNFKTTNLIESVMIRLEARTQGA